MRQFPSRHSKKVKSSPHFQMSHTSLFRHSISILISFACCVFFLHIRMMQMSVNSKRRAVVDVAYVTPA